MTSKVWCFTSFAGGAGQSTFILHIGLALAKEEHKVILLSQDHSLEILSRNMALPENLHIYTAEPGEIENKVIQARAEGEIILVDHPKTVEKPEWCDHQVAILTPNASCIAATHRAIAESETPIIIAANRVPTVYHGQRLLNQFQKVCGSTCSKSATPLGSVPQSALLSLASDNGLTIPSWLEWTPVGKALAEMSEALVAFSIEGSNAEPFHLADIRATDQQEAA